MYTGILIDAACPAEEKGAPMCDPTPSTRSFAILVSGDQLKAVRLDNAGNAKAAAALKDGNAGGKPDDPNATRRSLIVTVTGAMRGDEIQVESLKID